MDIKDLFPGCFPSYLSVLNYFSELLQIHLEAVTACDKKYLRDLHFTDYFSLKMFDSIDNNLWNFF